MRWCISKNFPAYGLLRAKQMWHMFHPLHCLGASKTGPTHQLTTILHICDHKYFCALFFSESIPTTSNRRNCPPISGSAPLSSAAMLITQSGRTAGKQRCFEYVVYLTPYTYQWRHSIGKWRRFFLKHFNERKLQFSPKTKGKLGNERLKLLIVSSALFCDFLKSFYLFLSHISQCVGSNFWVLKQFLQALSVLHCIQFRIAV